MGKFPTIPGPHKIKITEHASELFEIEKAVMATAPYLYQFKSIEEFIECLTVQHNCSLYIWNDDKGETAGFFAHEYFPEKNIDELLLIVTLPQFQGQGYGKKMMQFYFESLTKCPQPAQKSIIFTHEKNSNAIKFYESLGYKFIKKIPNLYNDGQTRIELSK